MTDDELRDLLAKATKGPWIEGSMDEDRGSIWIGGRNVEGGGFVYPYLAMTFNWPENYRANSRLIALAPTLAARVLADAEKIARLTEALRKVQEHQLKGEFYTAGHIISDALAAIGEAAS